MEHLATFSPSPSLGVICARFQVAELHEGHKWFIDQVRARHTHVLIVLGTTVVKMSPVNPLTYEDRKEMLKQTYPGADWLLIDRVADHPNDAYWSQMLDAAVTNNVAFLAEKTNQKVLGIKLYGSRGSFLPYYSGAFQTEEITAVQEFLSGTAHRQEICANPAHTVDYRRGKIAACADRYPISYTTVDGVIYDRSLDKFLIGKKKGSDVWQFIGGFTDPTDVSLEEAIRREAGEEVIDWRDFDDRGDDRATYKEPIKLGEIKYLASLRIDDRRFRGEPDKIMTAVFLCIHDGYSGQLSGGDDIEKVNWVSLADMLTTPDMISEIHHPIVKVLLKHFIKAPKDI
jgi:bifunctional NMN adenylyltransferase/nudix hydrolase